MKIIKIALLGVLAVALTACFNTDILGGDIKADTDDGTGFNSLVTTGLLQKFNDVQTKAITLTGTNGSNVITLNFAQVGGDTTTNCIDLGNYEFSNPTNNAQVLFTSGGETYTNVLFCTASITDCNEEENLLSGTFEGSVVSTTGDTLSFSNGTFENIKYIVQ